MVTVTEYRLSFCTIANRDDDIAIVEIDEGVNVDADMAREITDLAAQVLGKKRIGLLSNRINSYSLSFDAMIALALCPNMYALAIVTHSNKSRISVEAQNLFVTHIKKIPIKIFMDVNSGIEWLHTKADHKTSQQKYHSTAS